MPVHLCGSHQYVDAALYLAAPQQRGGWELVHSRLHTASLQETSVNEHIGARLSPLCLVLFLLLRCPCADCPKGFYLMNDGACTPCPPGGVSTTINALSCGRCAAGTPSAAQDVCLCPDANAALQLAANRWQCCELTAAGGHTCMYRDVPFPCCKADVCLLPKDNV